MDADVTILPTDPARRAELYRQWIATDAPQSTRRAPTVAPIPNGEPSPRAAGPAWLEEAIVAPPGAVAGFVRAVMDEMVESELPLDARRRLVDRAARLGLGRFDANLVIAAVQNRVRRAEIAEAEEAPPARRRRLGIVPLVLIVVGIEMLAVATFLLAR